MCFFWVTVWMELPDLHSLKRHKHGLQMRTSGQFNWRSGEFSAYFFFVFWNDKFNSNGYWKRGKKKIYTLPPNIMQIPQGELKYRQSWFSPGRGGGGIVDSSGKLTKLTEPVCQPLPHWHSRMQLTIIFIAINMIVNCILFHHSETKQIGLIGHND